MDLNVKLVEVSGKTIRVKSLRSRAILSVLKILHKNKNIGKLDIIQIKQEKSFLCKSLCKKG